jgi:hypothetical protein
MTEPYIYKEQVYITISQYQPFGPEKKDYVQAIDLKLTWSIYEDVLSDMSILDHHFIIDTHGHALKFSGIDVTKSTNSN